MSGKILFCLVHLVFSCALKAKSKKKTLGFVDFLVKLLVFLRFNWFFIRNIDFLQVSICFHSKYWLSLDFDWFFIRNIGFP